MCARELPELDALAPELAQRGVGMLALSVTPEQASVARASAQLGLKLPVAYTESEMLAPNGLRGVPSLLFVNRDGVVVSALSGRQRASVVRERALALAR